MPTIQFKGKSFVQNHHLAVPYHQLVPEKDKSLTESVSLHDNLIIHGDNLLALKALLPTYAGKVKCIYIDPPYNTGSEKWVYSDSVNSPLMKEWLGNVVGKDGEDFVRHDKWLCMAMPRLKLLRELLADDGAIFVSIDDNEQHHLRELMDEVFGEENFVTNIIWQKKYAASNDAKYFSDNHDFIIAYAKAKNGSDGWKRNLLPRTVKQDGLYKFDSNDGMGLWRPDNLTVKTYSKAYDYPIVNPSSGKEYQPTQGRCWLTNKDTMQRWIDEGRVFFGKDGKGAPQLKRYLSEVQAGTVPVTIWSYEDVGHTDEARKELKEIFIDNKAPFENPKPSRLIKRILQLATDEKSIVLDSFAGSGTTAQAVLELNKEDSGNRRFILVEMESYANNITSERVRRVIKGVPTAKNELVKAGLGGTFSYFELGDPIETKSILDGSKLPSYLELARYIFYTATGEEFDESKLNSDSGFIGASKHYDVYMIYKPDIEYLKQTALTLNKARELRGLAGARPLLVFAPTKYVELGELNELKIDFCQLPFEIYKVGK